jgi:hypothetical protein
MYEGKLVKRIRRKNRRKRNVIDTQAVSVSTKKTLAMNGVCFPRFLAIALQSDPGGSPSVRWIRLRSFPVFWNCTRMGVSTTGIFSNVSRLGFERAVPDVENILPDVRYRKYIFRLCPRAINF